MPRNNRWIYYAAEKMTQATLSREDAAYIANRSPNVLRRVPIQLRLAADMMYTIYEITALAFDKLIVTKPIFAIRYIIHVDYS